MALAIWIPILITILGIAYILTIGRLTDIIPILGFGDDVLVILLIVGIWAVYLIQQTVLSIITDWRIILGAVLIVLFVLATMFGFKKVKAIK